MGSVSLSMRQVGAKGYNVPTDEAACERRSRSGDPGRCPGGAPVKDTSEPSYRGKYQVSKINLGVLGVAAVTTREEVVWQKPCSAAP
jgi:hypothetical protein